MFEFDDNYYADSNILGVHYDPSNNSESLPAKLEPICPYCSIRERKLIYSKKVTGEIVYPHRPDLAKLKFFYCANGHDPAYVGTHKDSGIPLGTLANASLRSIRRQAHLAFDRLWKYSKKKRKSRTHAYKQLQRYMRLSTSNCHIGEFDEEQCQQVIDWSYKIKPEFSAIKEE